MKIKIIILLLLCSFFITQLSAVEYRYSKNSFNSIRLKNKYHALADSSQERITLLLKMLRKSPTLSKLVVMADKIAQRQYKDLKDFIKESNASYYDLIFTRQFDSKKIELVHILNKQVIHIDKNNTIVNTLVDLAHELTHFVFQEKINPYSTYLSPSQFIKNRIEGKGGEFHAFKMECFVYKDIFPEKLKQNLECTKYFDPKYKKSLLIEFYKLGKYHKSFIQRTRELGIASYHLPLVSSRQFKFVSSRFESPYPLALLEEYLATYKSICINDQKRLDAIKEFEVFGQKKRYPDALIKKFESNFWARCQNFL